MKTQTNILFILITLIALSFGFSTHSSWATEKAPSTENETKPQFVAEDPGPVYTQAVHQWAELTHFAKNAADGAVGRLKTEIDMDPKLKGMATPAFVADLKQFFYELFISQETITSLAKLYAQYFTLDEMNELINFYKTPLGQKLIKTNSEITLKSQLISMDLLKKHEQKYMQIIVKYIKPEGVTTPTPNAKEQMKAPIPEKK